MNTGSIDVQIHASEIVQARSEHHVEAMIVSRLRDAGVPVIGIFVLRGVKHGELTQERNEQGALFRWRAENFDLFNDCAPQAINGCTKTQ